MSPAAKPAAGRGGGTVLVVEDDADIRDSLAAILEGRGYVVHTACDGAEGLALLRAGLRPCLTLVDLMMPVMNGWEFRAELLRDPELVRLKVVVLSGVADIRQHAATLGAVSYLSKPINLPMLFGTLEQYC